MVAIVAFPVICVDELTLGKQMATDVVIRLRGRLWNEPALGEGLQHS
jgi:hypothetical protein